MKIIFVILGILLRLSRLLIIFFFKKIKKK
jgi:hypothetical protein